MPMAWLLLLMMTVVVMMANVMMMMNLKLEFAATADDFNMICHFKISNRVICFRQLVVKQLGVKRHLSAE